MRLDDYRLLGPGDALTRVAITLTESDLAALRKMLKRPNSGKTLAQEVRVGNEILLLTVTVEGEG